MQPEVLATIDSPYNKENDIKENQDSHLRSGAHHPKSNLIQISHTQR